MAVSAIKHCRCTYSLVDNVTPYFANKIYLALFREGLNSLSGILSESILSHKTVGTAGCTLQIIHINPYPANVENMVSS
jgi:hypothetical protein